MAAFYQDVTSGRATEPDPETLLTQLRALDASTGVQHLAGTALYKLKKATAWAAPQIASAQTAIDTASESTPTIRFQRTSREKDVLADAAARVRSRDIPAWLAMTGPQKKTATIAEADAWVTIRDFIEANL